MNILAKKSIKSLVQLYSMLLEGIICIIVTIERCVHFIFQSNNDLHDTFGYLPYYDTILARAL